MDALEIKEVNGLRDELNQRPTTQYVDGSDRALQLQLDQVESDLVDLENEQLQQENRLIAIEQALPGKATKTYVDDKDAALQSELDRHEQRIDDLEGRAQVPTLSALVASLEPYFIKVGTPTGDPDADNVTGLLYNAATRQLTLTTADETHTVTLPEAQGGATLHTFVPVLSNGVEQPQSVKQGHYYLFEGLLVERKEGDTQVTSAALRGAGFSVVLGGFQPIAVNEFGEGRPDVLLPTAEAAIRWLFAHPGTVPDGTAYPVTPPPPAGGSINVHGVPSWTAPDGVDADQFEYDVTG